jgi:hypothetical protein
MRSVWVWDGLTGTECGMCGCKQILCAAAGFLLAAGLASAQEVIPPPDGFAPGWVKPEAPRVFQRGELFNYIDGGAEIFLEFGFDKLIVQAYEKAEMELTVEAYRLDSPESALGLYLLKCGKETPVKGLEGRHTGDRFQLTILRNRWFIHINNADGLPDAVPAMTVLARKILAGLPQGPRVALLDALPLKSIVSGTEMIFRGPFGLQSLYTLGPGDILQQNRKVFGLAADYKSAAGDTYTRLLIRYPDIPAAQAAWNNLRANLDSYIEVVDSDARSFVFRDFQGKYGSAELKAAWIEILVNLPTQPIQ